MTEQHSRTPRSRARAFRPSRRAVLGGVAGTLLTGALPPASAAAGVPTLMGDDYNDLRDRWLNMIVGEFDGADPRFASLLTELADHADNLQDQIVRTPGRDRVFSGVPIATNAPGITQTLRHLVSLALAYRTPGSALEGDTSIRTDALDGLRTTHDIVYHAGKTPFGNWWEWEIGSPRALMDASVLMYNDLSGGDVADYTAAIDHFVPSPLTGHTGANRVDVCRSVAIRGILGRSSSSIAGARDGLSDVFQYVTTGDGFYRDGSFIQHTWVPYTGTYGTVLLDGVSRLIALLAGSPWEITDPNRQIIFDAVETAFAPVIHDGRMMDFVRGRAISRHRYRDHHDGHSAIEHILRLADGVEPIDSAAADRWRAACKGWFTRDVLDDFLENAGSGTAIPRFSRVLGVLDDPAIPSAPEPDGFTLFGSMDRAVHRRSGWAYAIAMTSKRISFYECGNGENEKGFHTSTGMTYLYDGDNSQFTDNFWPTVNLYRLPGTTVSTKPLPNKAGGEWGTAKPITPSWAGGASLGDEFGAVGMDLFGLLATVRGRKSWFCLDDQTVALGAAITASETPPATVETIVENRNLHATGTNTLIIDDLAQPSTVGWSTTVTNPQWAHIEGVGGYIFPQGAVLNALRQARTGSWRDVDLNGPTAPITRRYLTMWFDHGSQPAGDTYAYALLPRASAAETKQRAQNSNVTVLSNTGQLQAIDVPHLNLTAANFWSSGAVEDITASAACSLLMRENPDGSLTLAVADPTHEGASISITVVRPGFSAWSADETITVQAVSPSIQFTVNTAQARGATHSVTFTTT